jgi:hypothetical protein
MDAATFAEDSSMNISEFARLSLRERDPYIVQTTESMGLSSEMVVEKDFWVVWLLDVLFSLSDELGPFTFKGGTSLSKGFNLIRRFSEDVDISIQRDRLGFPDDATFYEAPSRNALKREIETIRTKETFFFRPRDRYDLAKPGTLKVIFPDSCRETFKADYAEMQSMIFEGAPSLEALCQRLRSVESQIKMGMLMSSLGRERVVILVKGFVDLPSDAQGIIYLRFEKHVREVVPKLAERLQAAGFTLKPEDVTQACS